jgi:hypothetical protein
VLNVPVPALPENAILVHIGPHKTGTTAIQSILAASRDVLAEHGVLYPGRGVAHHQEARALRQFGEGWEHDRVAPPDDAVWTSLAQTARSSRKRVVISSEFFAEADAEQRARLVRELGADRVHILTAARQPAGLAGSTWQQVLRQGRPVSLEEWLDKNFRRSEFSARPRGYWSHADPVAVVSRWIESIVPERITVVALDERDKRLLPATFEQLLGLPDGLLADQSPPQLNRGLTGVEAALFERIVKGFDSRLTWPEYSNMMRKGVIRRVLEVRRPSRDEPKSTLPAWAVEQAMIEAERTIDGLGSLGVQIVGDLDALRVPPPAPGSDVPVTEIPIDLAAEAIVGALAAASGHHWSFARRTTRTRGRAAATEVSAPAIDDVPTRELAAALVRRVTRRGR